MFPSPVFPLSHLTISLHSEECLPMRHQILLAILLGGLVCTIAATPGPAQTLESRQDASLDYPIEVLEADPYWQPAGKWALESPLTTMGAMRALYRKLGTLPAQRLRLPVPNSPWKLTGRASRTGDGILYAAFGRYLYRSTDEGRSWQGQEAGQPSRRPRSTGQHRRLRERRPVPLSGPRSPGAAPHRPPGGESVLPGGHLPIQRRRPDLASQRSPETSLQENRGRRQSHRQPGRRRAAGQHGWIRRTAGPECPGTGRHGDLPQH